MSHLTLDSGFGEVVIRARTETDAAAYCADNGLYYIGPLAVDVEGEDQDKYFTHLRQLGSFQCHEEVKH